MRVFRSTSLALGVALLLVSLFVPATAGSKAVSFKSQIKPILTANCVGCHNSGNSMGGLDLSSNSGIRKGGVSGKLYTAGKGSASLIVKRLKGQGGDTMPKGDSPLKASQISLVSKWINEGAKM